MTGRRTLPLIAALAMAPALAMTPVLAQDSTRTHLIIADQFVPDILDGQQSTGGYALSHELISQPLVRFDAETGAFVPDLLESFAISENGQTMTMVLPEGAVYSNGNPLGAAALKAAIERYVAVSPYAFDYDGMGEIRVIDARTIELDNAIGFNVMLPTFMSSFGAPWDVSVAAEVGDAAFAANPVASGPFMIGTPWTPGLDLEMLRNDKYHTAMPMVENHGPAYLERVTTRFIADPQTRANELEAGSVDIVFGLPGAALRYMADDPAYQILSVPLPGMTGLTFNTSRAPFDEPALRRALAMAMDRDQMALALEGAASSEWAFVNSAMIAYSPDAPAYMQSHYPFDPAAAKAALAAIGWTDDDGDGIVSRDGKPLAIELLIDSSSAISTGVAPVIQAQLAAVGVDAQIAMVDGAAHYDTMNAGNYDLSLSGYIWVDPDILTYRFTEGSAPSHYAPAELAAALTSARGVADPAARTAAYLDIQKGLMDDVPMVPLLSENLLIGARSWVQGIKILPPARLILNDLKIVE